MIKLHSSAIGSQWSDSSTMSRFVAPSINRANHPSPKNCRIRWYQMNIHDGDFFWSSITESQHKKATLVGWLLHPSFMVTFRKIDVFRATCLEMFRHNVDRCFARGRGHHSSPMSLKVATHHLSSSVSDWSSVSQLLSLLTPWSTFAHHISLASESCLLIVSSSGSGFYCNYFLQSSLPLGINGHQWYQRYLTNYASFYWGINVFNYSSMGTNSAQVHFLSFCQRLSHMYNSSAVLCSLFNPVLMKTWQPLIDWNRLIAASCIWELPLGKFKHWK